MGSDPNEPSYEVLWPLAALANDDTDLANDRVTDLNGKVVAELLDMSQLETFFPQLRAGLKRRYPGVTIIPFEEFGLVHGPDEHAVIADLPNKLKAKGVDIALCGVGA
jgi:hypothetical protein